MKIGFDAKRAMRNFTGLGNYSRYVLELLSEYESESSLVAYSSKKPKGRAVRFFEENGRIVTRYPKSFIGRLMPSVWRSFCIAKDIEREHVDIYHGLSGELPFRKLKGVKTVVTVHDLIFRHYPELYKPFDRFMYDLKFRRACRRADAVIAISEFTKRDIVDCYHIDPARIDVVYQGCDSSFRMELSRERLEEVKRKYSLPDRYILNVGTVEERKNVLLAVRALEKTDGDVSLVIVGRHTPYADTVFQYARDKGLSGRIQHIPNADFSDLPCIYRMAQIFVYPSRIEGFGIPLLEALWSEVPVIGATGSCLEEAGGPESVYVNPDDVEGLASWFNRLLREPETCRKMVESGLEYAKTFSDSSFCVKTVEIYRKLLA